MKSWFDEMLPLTISTKGVREVGGSIAIWTSGRSGGSGGVVMEIGGGSWFRALDGQRGKERGGFSLSSIESFYHDDELN